MRGKAQREPARLKCACKTQGLLDQSSPSFIRQGFKGTLLWGVIGGVNALIHDVDILPSVVECLCTGWKWSTSIFADSRQLSVAIATSLRDREKKIGLIIMFTCVKNFG